MAAGADAMNVVNNFGLDLVNLDGVRRRAVRITRTRVISGDNLNEFDYKLTYRFTKQNVGRLVEMFRPRLEHINNRGLPVSPLVQLEMTLAHFAGNNFHRVSGQSHNIGRAAARNIIMRVTDAIIEYKDQFVYLPSREEMRKTADKMLLKYKLPNFALAIDGIHLRLGGKPHGIPDHHTQQHYFCRKQFYSINCQVTSNDLYICDLDMRWPGKAHDSRIYTRSDVKQWLEHQVSFTAAADTAYPQSRVLVKPFKQNEMANDERRKRLFNKRLSGLRTAMSENIFGRWCRRFPIIKDLRTHLPQSQKTVLATAILQNIAVQWNEEQVGNDDEEGGGVGDGDGDGVNGGGDGGGDGVNVALIAGQTLRQLLMDQMP